MRKYVNRFLMVAGLLAFFATAGCKSSGKDELTLVKIIPEPVKIDYADKILTIGKGIDVVSKDPALSFSRTYLIGQIKKLPGYAFLPEKDDSAVKVVLKLDGRIEQAEGYILEIDKNITISGKTKNGVLYGIQSLLQILQQAPASSEGLDVPRLKITDYPRFAYRGMHLDVSRHFFGIDFIKKYIDLIAMHKMNTFHWHLTDDQGWRIEIRKYPKLTEVGAWRVDHEDLPWNERPDQKEGEKATYGGYYTQEQIRNIVSYAAERGITIIPEIEMPGHSAAAIAAYPELSCQGKQIGVTSGGIAKVNILCAGKDQTFQFMQDVLTEVMELFPSKYIHIGGDEAWKSEWKKCPLCQKRMKDEGLANEEELQSYFIKRIDDFLTSRGRTLVGWDEILQGGLAKNATVMSWRGESGGIKAAQMKHNVIMTPVDYCYFDYYQSLNKDIEPLAFNGYIPLSKVYNYEPVPAELDSAEAKYVLGAQGNVWTEYMPTEKVAEYRVLPRMTALSEVLWSPKEKRNETDFISRLQPFLDWLSENNYNFHIPAPEGMMSKMIFIDSVRVKLVNPWPFARIRYTLDGSDPSVSSDLYEKPFTVKGNLILKACVFLKDGRHGLIKTSTINKVEPILPYSIDTTDLQPGLSYNYYEIAINSVGEIKKHHPKSRGVMDGVGLPAEHRQEVFAADFNGYFYVPRTGVYTFALSSDDGSQFYLGEHLTIDHDGPHGPSAEFGQIALQKGYYPIYLGYFDGGGGNSLTLQMKSDGGEMTDIPQDQFFHKKQE